jgi:NAD(P)-dependent dehydrogenase (short-subunit alcohol dehydrogenase family)
MLARGSGVIINISSMFGQVAVPQRLAYCVSKAAVNMMTKVMAIEWAARGVRVNAIAPGYVETEFIGGLIARGVLDPTQLARRTPMGRLGSSDEIAEAALFLATPAASFITGEILTVDGGWSSYGFL